jgi:hypothetical protein
MVWEEADAKRTVAVPADHESDVEAFVHAPPTVHVSDPKAMYEAAEMLTFPVTVTAPEVLRSAPPLSVRLPFTVKGFAPLVRDPALTVRLDAVSWEASVSVPEMDREAKDCPDASVTFCAAPVKLTVEAVDVNPAAEDVSQEPAMLSVAEAKVIVAAPEEVRLPLKVGVEDVSVRMPANVRPSENVVETPLLTVRLFTVCVTFTVPPDAFTTTVDAPEAKEPALVSIDRTVSIEPFAVTDPPAPTVRVTAVRGRFEAEVDRVVVPAPPCTVRALAARSPFAARVNVVVFDPLLKLTL